MYDFPKNVYVVSMILVCCLCVCMSEVISSFRSLKAGLHVFALPMLFLCVIWHTMWSGKSLRLLCILPLVNCVCLHSERCL